MMAAHVTLITDASGQQTAQLYSAFGELTKRTTPGAVTPVETLYDVLGRVEQVTSGAGVVLHHYDSQGDLTALSTGASAPSFMTRSYDSLGRVVGATYSNPAMTSVAQADRLVANTFGSDGLGRLTEDSIRVGAGPLRSVRAAWSAAAGTWTRDITTTASVRREVFDGAFRLARSGKLSAGVMSEVTAVDWLGARVEEISSEQGSQSPFRRTHSYDGFGALASQTATAIDLGAGRLPLDSAEGLAYCGGAWDAARCGAPLYGANVIRDVIKGKVVSHQSGFAAPAHFTSLSRARPWRGYSYDALSRLEHSYEQDGVQSVVSAEALPAHLVNPPVAALASASRADDWVYARESTVGSTVSIRRQSDSKKRWALVGARGSGYQMRGVEVDNASRSLQHDAAGRIRDDGKHLFAFDVLNRLSEVDSGAEAYAYDGLGRLVARYESGALRETWLYDGHQMVAAFDATGATKWEAVWGDGVDQLLEWRDAQGGGGRQLPIVDGRNSVVGSWSASTRTLLGTAEYTAEGRLRTRAADGTTTCEEEGTGVVCAAPGGMPFAFTSAWRSNATGLVYLRNRWYSTELGEFLSHDPAGYPDSFNPYAYVGLDPINGWDPFGLEEWKTTKKPASKSKERLIPVGIELPPELEAANERQRKIDERAEEVWGPDANRTLEDIEREGKRAGKGESESYCEAGGFGCQTNPVPEVASPSAVGRKATEIISQHVGGAAFKEMAETATVAAIIAKLNRKNAAKAAVRAEKGNQKLLGAGKWQPTGFKPGELERHFNKHAGEWGAGNITKDAYAKRAGDLLGREPGGQILGHTRANGDILRYNTRTNEFAVGAQDGTIRTLFRPDDGLSYWNKQVAP